MDGVMCSKIAGVLLVVMSGAFAESSVEWNPSVDIVEDAVWRMPVQPIEVDGPRVVVKDGRFFLDGERYRVWGVNLSFGANLPAPEDAAMVAERLAAAGVNAVRMHHMDTAKYPRGLMHREGGLRIDPEALARLDRFIAELARKGIRVNLNLHVGAAYSGMLKDVPEVNVKYDKLYLQFVPELQEGWRSYARMLLEHRNPHRNDVRYADDPAIAWVEVSNENSFWFGGYLNDVRHAPEFYREMLEGQYVGWLRERYQDDAGLRKAWNVRSEPLGADQIELVEAKNRWNLEQHGGAEAKRTPVTVDGAAGMRLEPTSLSGQDWHLQYNIRPLAVEKGRYYTLSFQARADKKRRIGATVSMAHEPWRALGLAREVKLRERWESFRLGFVAEEDDGLARVSFTFGGEKVPLELLDVRLQPGGQVGVADGESLAAGRVAVWGESETVERSNDRLRFLAATEKKFFDMGRDFIRGELGSRALVVGTQGYGPLGLYAQDGMDFIDTHAYWQHPHFPRRPWDQGDWVIRRTSIVDHPGEATFLNLASHRRPGRPFTVSEYNHPAPNDFQVECVPMMAAVAAAEDWDGVWFYTYEHNNDRWDGNTMESFFDFRANPAKWAFMPAGAMIFRGAGIGPKKGTFLSSLKMPTAKETWADPAKAMEVYRFNRGGRGKTAEELATLLLGEGNRGDGGRGFFLREGENGAVAAGYAADFAKCTGKLRISAPEFCAITLAVVGGGGVGDGRGLLLTACGRAENPGMEFNAERTTVGRAWGQGPTRAEAVAGTLALPKGKKGTWRAWALKPDGSRGEEVPVTREGEGGVPRLRMSPEHGTLCYWLERR
jgi:hypothetical protein